MKAKLNLLTIAIFCAMTSSVYAVTVSEKASKISDDTAVLTAVLDFRDVLIKSDQAFTATVSDLSRKIATTKNYGKSIKYHEDFLTKNLSELKKLSSRRGELVFKVKNIANNSQSVTDGFKSGVKGLNPKTAGGALKLVGVVADTTSRGIEVYDDYQNYGVGVAVSTTVLTLTDEAADFLNPLGFAAAISGLTIDDKPVTEWNGWGDQIKQRGKIFFEYDLADFVRKPAELIKTLGTEDQAHMAYLDAVNAAWTKISKDGVLGYQNRMKKLMAIDDPDKFLAEAKDLQQDHMREIDGLIKGLQVFSDTMVENVQPDSNFIRRWYVDGNLNPDRKVKYLAWQDQADTLNKLLNKYKAENKSVSISSDVVDAWLLKQVFQAKIDVELNDAKLFMAAAKIDAMQKTVAQPSVVDKSVLPTVLTNNNQMGSSHLGTAQGYLAPGTKLSTSYADVKTYSTSTDNKIKSGTEQVALAQNTQAFDVLQDWTVTEGDQAKHFSIGDGFGSITAPDPNKPTIAALNNADVQQTTMTKVYKVPVGTKQVNVGMLANFVTNEYPEFVGSEFNDKATIEIKTGSGNIYQATLFNKELNSANFTDVSGLPSPMSGSGGQTGFEQLNKTINVANGGNLTITVKTANVGDMAVPSATLINATSVK